MSYFCHEIFFSSPKFQRATNKARKTMKNYYLGALITIFAGLLSFQSYSQDDIGVIAIPTIVDGCDLQGPIQVRVTYQNFNSGAYTGTINFEYSINGVSSGVETEPVSIGGGATGSYTFTAEIQTADLVFGINDFWAEAEAGLLDTDPSNNRLDKDFTNSEPTLGGDVTSDATHCAGSNTGTLTLANERGAVLEWQLSENSGASWSSIPGNTTNTLTYNNLNTTTLYRAKVQNGACNVEFSTFATITINPIPPAPIATSNSPVCEGGTINLSASNEPGGTYSWSGPDLFNSTVREPTIPNATTDNAGTYDVTVTVNTCTSPIGQVTVNIKPTPAALNPTSNSPVCEGDTIRLMSDLVANVNYSWSGPDNFSSSAQNPTRNNALPAHAGDYTVFGTLDGCVGPSATTNVVISSRPAAPTSTSNSPICEGEDLQLTATGGPGVTWEWTGPNGFTSTLQNPVIPNVTTAEAGNYTVVAINGGCRSIPVSTGVNVRTTPNPPTASSNSPVCEGQNINLNATTVTGATYTWVSSNGFNATGQNQVINNASATDAGDYGVLVTINGCTSDTNFTTVTVNPVPAQPTITTNSPTCTGQDINLSTPTVAGATYAWSGPAGFASTTQNPTISNVNLGNQGNYSLVITVAGCPSPQATEYVQVNQTPQVPGASSNTPLCEGETLNLTSSLVSSATYSWTGPNGFSSTQQNPSKANVVVADSGQYCVEVTVNGCTSPQNCIVVDVDFRPAAPIISANSPLCAGDTLFLSANTVTGATYAWSGPAGFSSTQQNPFIANVSGANAGDYRCIVTVGNCSSPFTQITVTVNPKPVTPSAASNSPVCEGDDINLTASTHAGATYIWSGPNSFSSNQQNPTINNATGNETGFYYVKISVNGCVSDSASTSVQVNGIPAPPTASSNTPVCEGDTMRLFTDNVQGAVYNWSGPNAFASSEQNPEILNTPANAGGVYEVVVTVNGCASTAGQTTVTVNPMPIKPNASNTSPVCEGQSFTLMVDPVAGASYVWSGPNNFASNLQNPSINNADANDAGEYLVYLLQNGCRGPADTTVVTVTVVPTPTVGSNSPLCEQGDLELTASTIPGATYTWTGPNGFSSTDQNPIRNNVTIADEGTYGVYATLNSCIGDVAETDVDISPMTMGGNVLKDTIVCTPFNNGPLSLVNKVGVVLRWESSINNGVNWTQLANTTTSYSFQDIQQETLFRALVQSPGCPEMHSTAARISTQPSAEAGFIEPTSPDVNYEVCVDGNSGSLFLREYTGDITHWETSIDEGQSWDSTDYPFDEWVFNNVPETTWYRAVVDGCNSTDTSDVYVLTVSAEACESILIANLVTPNNDEKNDTWLIEDIEEYPAISVKIYNRFGKEIYTNAQYDNSWDATFQGKALQDGTYYYVLTMEGNSKVFKGAINVLR